MTPLHTRPTIALLQLRDNTPEVLKPASLGLFDILETRRHVVNDSGKIIEINRIRLLGSEQFRLIYTDEETAVRLIHGDINVSDYDSPADIRLTNLERSGLGPRNYV